MTDTQEPELLPCPFCRDNMDSFAGLFEGAFCTTQEPTRYSIGCDCGSTGPIVETMEKAMEAWNTRADGWLPIERAPKDLTTVIIYQYKHRDWVFPEGEGVQAIGFWDGSSYNTSCGHIPIIDISHWRLRPAPPKVDE